MWSPMGWYITFRSWLCVEGNQSRDPFMSETQVLARSAIGSPDWTAMGRRSPRSQNSWISMRHWRTQSNCGAGVCLGNTERQQFSRPSQGQQQLLMCLCPDSNKDSMIITLTVKIESSNIIFPPHQSWVNIFCWEKLWLFQSSNVGKRHQLQPGFPAGWTLTCAPRTLGLWLIIKERLWGNAPAITTPEY